MIVSLLGICIHHNIFTALKCILSKVLCEFQSYMFWYIATKTDYLSMTMGTRFAYVFVPFDNRLPSVSSTLQHFSNNKTKNIKKIIQIFQALRSGSALILKSTFHTYFSYIHI